MRIVKINDIAVDQFPVISIEDGYTKVSGETAFTKTVWKNGVLDSVPATISEINSSGEYKMEFTPDDIGFWKVEVLIDYNKDLLGFEYVADTGDTEYVYQGISRLLGLSHENIFIDNKYSQRY